MRSTLSAVLFGFLAASTATAQSVNMSGSPAEPSLNASHTEALDTQAPRYSMDELRELGRLARAISLELASDPEITLYFESQFCLLQDVGDTTEDLPFEEQSRQASAWLFESVWSRYEARFPDSLSADERQIVTSLVEGTDALVNLYFFGASDDYAWRHAIDRHFDETRCRIIQSQVTQLYSSQSGN
jgi:hypothetical protein